MDPTSSINLVVAGKAAIDVAASQFFVPIIDQTTQKPILYNHTNEAACAFKIYSQSASSEGYWTMGSSFLSSMYLVYDLDNGQISIVQAKANITEEPDIVIVEAGPTGVANA